MKTTINCFLPFSRLEETVQTVKELRASTLVDKIYLLASPITNVCIPGCELISVEKMQSTQAMRAIAEHSDKTYTLLYTKHTALKIGMFALESSNGNDPSWHGICRPLPTDRRCAKNSSGH